MTSKAIRELVDTGFGYLNQGNQDAFFALYSDDLRTPTLASFGLPTNKQGFKTFVGGFFKSFSEPQFLPQKVLTDDDTALFHWIFKGRHTADFNGVKPTGKSVEINAFVSFRVAADGKIIEQHDVGDMLSLLRQIGAM